MRPSFSDPDKRERISALDIRERNKALGKEELIAAREKVLDYLASGSHEAEDADRDEAWNVLGLITEYGIRVPREDLTMIVESVQNCLDEVDMVYGGPILFDAYKMLGDGIRARDTATETIRAWEKRRSGA
ncbi:MAG: hypothetical protein HYS81_04720 [Candidatus Aenigmatarchaeota archaeon]|nr:MAG: hypothetical protein HYS81_04720 [Candidatus Aenigmarchaeota archaeon]